MTNDTTAAHEAATIEAMHTQAAPAPDLEYTPIPDPLPQLVRREELDAMSEEIKRLRADNATLRAQLNGWNTMPAEALIAYWNAHGGGDDALGDWIGELRAGINAGRYYAGLEPL